MKNNNYFDKFMNDLEQRELEFLEKRKLLQIAQEEWQVRRDLDKNYREHVAQRIRYDK